MPPEMFPCSKVGSFELIKSYIRLNCEEAGEDEEEEGNILSRSGVLMLLYKGARAFFSLRSLLDIEGHTQLIRQGDLMVWQLPDVEEVAVVDPRVAPLLPGRQVASVFGLSVHLPHKPYRSEKYLEPIMFCSEYDVYRTYSG